MAGRPVARSGARRVGACIQNGQARLVQRQCLGTAIGKPTFTANRTTGAR
jgi:hypothetical protein